MAGRRRIALLVEYDGTAFAGSQAQPACRTVQDTVEASIVAFTGETQRTRFAGRTDTGVHALGQVVTFDTESAHTPARVRDALNHFLPEDVAVRAACEVAADFDPRRHATSRLYRYVIEHGSGRAPLTRHTAWQREGTLDVAAMAAAAALLPREPRDWAAFAGPVPDGRSTVRTLARCEVQSSAEGSATGRLDVWMEADAFLPHQVRRTVGAMERVGAGRMTPARFAQLIEEPASTAGPAAPPQGLALVAVRYPPGLVDWGQVNVDRLNWETVEWDDNEDVSPER